MCGEEGVNKRKTITRMLKVKGEMVEICYFCSNEYSLKLIMSKKNFSFPFDRCGHLAYRPA